MKTTLRRIGNAYGVLLPKRVIEHIGLEENDELTIRETSCGIELLPYEAEFYTQVEAFRRTERRHRNSYHRLGNER